jgi:group I intron endonuclease
MIGIYKITSPSGKIYIGQSINIEKRFKNYKNLSCKNQPILYKSFLKYGVENHIFEIIEECKHDQLNLKERYYQDLFNVVSTKGLNCRLQETDILPRIVSEETKKKMSNRIILQETKNKISKTLLGHVGHFLNKKHTEDTKKKISQGNKGKKMSKEAREKMSKAKKGRILSEITKEKIKLGNIGKGMSIENRKKVSERVSKPIIQYDLNDNFIKEWKTVTEAKKFFKGDIPATLKGRQKQSCGFKWKYKYD